MRSRLLASAARVNPFGSAVRSAHHLQRLLPTWLAAIAGLAAGAGIVHKPSLLFGALGLLAVLAIGPAALFLGVLGIEEQLSSAGLDNALVHPMVSIGSDLFYRTSFIGLVLPTAVVLTLIVLARSGFRAPKGAAIGTVGALWGGVLAWTQGAPIQRIPGLVSAWLLLVCGVVLGAYLRRSPNRRIIAQAVVGLFVLKALIAIYLVNTGQGQPLGGSRILIYYDSTIAALAAAVILGLLFRPSTLPGPLRWIALVSCATVLGLSFRRTVWLAATIVLVVVLCFARLRRGIRWRPVVLAIVVLMAALSTVPGIQEALSGRTSSLLTALTGKSDDASAQGHAADIGVGWEAAIRSPIFGVGVDARQLPGLASRRGSRLYVHNDYLQVWLRYGLPGLSFQLITLALALGTARAALTRTKLDFIGTMLAFFVLLSPIVYIAFPFFTETNRWPLVFGLAWGYASAHLDAASRPQLEKAAQGDASPSTSTSGRSVVRCPSPGATSA